MNIIDYRIDQLIEDVVGDSDYFKLYRKVVRHY